MSGRSLRRLPVLAQARHMGGLAFLPSVRRAHPVNGKPRHVSGAGGAAQVETWLEAMERVVDAQAIEKGRLEQ